MEYLPTICDEFGYNPVVFLAAGLGAVLTEVEHFAADADEGEPRGLMAAVFWQLFS